MNSFFSLSLSNIFKDHQDDSALLEPKRAEEDVLDQGELSWRPVHRSQR